jgi:AraC-like DNA-binding protein
MEKTMSLEDFYRKKLGELPSDILQKTGQFNVFRLSDYFGTTKAMPYSRKDYYKISLISGENVVHYADKTLKVEENMLLVANPQVPYNWEPLSEEKTGAFCVFTEDFMNGFGNFKDYPVFQSSGTPILSLKDVDFHRILAIYDRMFLEIRADYDYKYDLLRNLVFELIHEALKLQPAKLESNKTESKASERITSLFMELLERQFPIENPLQQIKLKSAGEFAYHLNIHANHLNRVLKETTGKTTSLLLNERISLEARALLKHTNWNIAEISWCLGFEDPSYFIKFFKKASDATPGNFRK